MNWVAIIWAASSGASMMLGVMQLFIWFKSHRRAKEYLALAFTAFAVAIVALFEWLMMTAQDPQRYADLVRWTHVPVFVMLTGIVAFVWYHFRTGTAWLAWAVIGLRGLVLALNFLFPESLGFKEINALKQISFFGQHFSVVAEAVSNPLNRFAELSALMFVVYVADATFRLWRRGGHGARRKAVLVGGGVLFFLVLAAVHTALVHAQLIYSPYIISLAFFGIVLPMAHESSRDVLESERLYMSLRQAEQQALVESVGKRRAEERTALVVEAAPNAMIMVDSSSRMVLVNRQAEQTFGYTRDEMLGKPVEMLIPARFGAHYATRIARYFERPESRAMGAGRDLFGLKKDGSEVPVEVGLNSVETAAGRFVLASIVEITERLRMEKEAAELRTELMHLSRVSMLGQLSGSLAHELNQPLAAVLSNAQAGLRFLLQGNPDMEEMQAILEDIAGDAKRAGGIIHGMKAMFQKDTRQELQPVDLDEVVSQVLDLLHSEFITRQAEVMFTPSSALPPVLAGRVELTQVLINLLLNSFDAMKELPAPRKAQITTAAEADRVVIRVRDFGPGIAPEIRGKLFTPFVSTKSGGLGIGLAISRRIVERFGGRLSAENHPGGGAEFSILLPPAPPANAPLQPQASAVSEPAVCT